MGTDSIAAIKAHTRVYLLVFGALAVFTVVTVGVSYLDVSVPMAVAIALLIASVKATLVACYFMHLLTERKALYSVLLLCVFFFIALVLLPILTHAETKALQNVT
ncbi:MAG: hypothetical protein GY778_23810 [bacterium]|nr:hypothetical protein [bacterium]